MSLGEKLKMEQYNPFYSERFKEDFRETLSYITFNLKNPNAAFALEKEVISETETRGKLAKAFKPYLYDKKNKRYLYYVKIRNFYAFYYIDEKKKIMRYVALTYARMSVANIIDKLEESKASKKK